MTDIRIKQNFNFAEPLWDWVVRSDTHLLDEREELATAVRVALGTDALAGANEILPDPDSTNRCGWWGDYEAEAIWDGWPIGTKNWLLTRAKITEAPSEEGSTLERARLYTRTALQPFIIRGVASDIEVNVVRTELQRIDVYVTIYRGPLEEIDLQYQLLWEDLDKAITFAEKPKEKNQSISIASPWIGSPSLVAMNQSMWVGSPELLRPTIAQKHVMAGSGKTVSAPVFGSPTLAIV